MSKSSVRLTGTFVVCAMLWGGVAVADPKAAETQFRANMTEVYQAFSALQPYLYQPDLFKNQKNKARISGLLKTLKSRFHTADAVKGSYGTEPGFLSTLQMAQEMLSDASQRFDEGNPAYALWRLRTSSTYCVSCHTRHEISADFMRDNRQILKSMNPYQQADFYYATRQFDKASQLFLAVVRSPAFSSVRFDALRKWLVIYVRVHPSPAEALFELNRLSQSVKFNPYERDEIEGWIESLKRWSEEEPSRVDSTEEAEKLIQAGMGGSGILLGRRGTVELLRATAMLHRLFDLPTDKEDQAHGLFLLGLAYHEIPFLFVSELPEMFLEQCIRDFPKTADARRAFALYQQVVEEGYTGSGGTSVPDDVQAKISELGRIAYGS